MRGAPLALLGILAVIAEVDGAHHGGWQGRVVRGLDGLAHDLQRLLVAGHQHSDVVWRLHLRGVMTVITIMPSRGREGESERERGER